MRKVYGIQLLLLMLSILAVAPVRSQEKKPVVIAIPVGLSGVNSVVAPAVVQSAELAADELNAKGGIIGQPVKVVPLDDESGPAGAVKAFNTGIRQDKADVIITMETSAARNAGAPIAERAKVPFIYTSFYEGRACGEYLFVNAWVPEQVVPPLIKFMTDEKNAKRWFAVGSDYAFGRGMIEAAKNTIKDMGGTILGEEYQPLQQSDWTAIISKIRAANPDGIIYSTSGGGPNIDFLKQLKAAGLTMPIGSLSIDELTAEAGGNAAQGVYYTGDYFTGIDNPENKRFLEAMKKKFGAELKTPNALSQQEYDGVHAYAMAVEKAGTTNADAVIKALPTVAFKGPRGPVQMNKQHHAPLPIYLAQVQADGKTKVLKDFGLIDPGDQCPKLK
ncbi:substrate-binding protein [Bradyrhizobium sp. URHD0069]|uniref:substrate-binding protein n=1 Tax=Bradyrhizobium sp. URHD0069 TaxID=1380355 RepID=UPI00049657D6|nr:substrate-binding protein [Bradyrhizobium sp. URHD0069]